MVGGLFLGAAVWAFGTGVHIVSMTTYPYPDTVGGMALIAAVVGFVVRFAVWEGETE